MMWSWWHHQSVTFRTRIGLQPSMKRLGWGSAPLNMRPWFSKLVDCPLRVGNESLPLIKEFKYLKDLVHEWGYYGVGDWLENWCSRSGFMYASTHRCNKKRAEPQGKALDLPVNLRSFPHLWSWRMGHDQKNKISDTSSWNGFPQEGGRCLP